MPTAGGVPGKLASHTGGYVVEGFTPDGKSLLVGVARDHHWRDADRFALIGVEDRTAEAPLFDSAGRNGQLSPDGKKLLFTREGAPWWRKGYKGSQDSQVWMFGPRGEDVSRKSSIPPAVPSGRSGEADGKAMFYVGLAQGLPQPPRARIRDQCKPTGRSPKFEDDTVAFPCHLARTAGTIVFRHLFDFYPAARPQGSSEPAYPDRDLPGRGRRPGTPSSAGPCRRPPRWRSARTAWRSP